MTIYLFCFGSSRKSPYGIISKIPSIRRTLENNANIGNLTAGRLRENFGISNNVTDGTLALFLLHEFLLDMSGVEESLRQTFNARPDIEEGRMGFHKSPLQLGKR